MKHKTNPYLLIILSFLGVIFIGSILFTLPISTKDRNGLNVIDALFTTVTSVCVTGLSVIPNLGETLSGFGKVLMAILIEIGGISFLTMAVFVISILGKKLGLSGTLIMREALNQNTASSITRLIKRIVLLSFTFQIIGIIVNLFVFIPYYDSTLKGIEISVFHAVSAFNNAGLDVFGFDNSMINFNDNILLNINTMFLIISGGIGFIVIYDIISNHRIKRFSVHTKIVLTTTFVLILGGFLLYKISMYKEMTFLEAMFLSVSTRTAGFASFDMSKLNNAAYLVTIFLMFIGASPCSTGGGIKTTTLFVAVISLIAICRGKNPKAFHRRISNASVYKAFALIVMSLMFVLLSIFLVSLFDKNLRIDQIVFECVSAFGTVGLSMGITSSLSIGSKIIIIISMFVGRLGPLTIMSVLNNNWMKNTDEEIKYVEEKIIIG